MFPYQYRVYNYSYRLIQGEIVRPWVLLDSLHSVVQGRFGGLIQFSEGEVVVILLASVLSVILAVWPKRERLTTLLL